MDRLFPTKLAKGDEIRVIAPSRSFAIICEEIRAIANQRLADLGFRLTFSKRTNEIDDFKSSSIESRIKDLHEAFVDPSVKGILTVIGGYNCNQLLNYIDWDLIKQNPKVLCGYSDITILNNAIFAKTGLVSYSGPHYSSFGQKLHFNYTLEHFLMCCMADEPFSVIPSAYWSDDSWPGNQDERNLIENPGWLIINEGEAEGIILGGNLCTINLLQGTSYMPSLNNSILFLEDDAHGDGSDIYEFDRNLQSLIHLPHFKGVRGLVIGRFQKAAGMTNDLLNKMIKSKEDLLRIPVIANVDFGHTDPKIAFPVGGDIAICADGGQAEIRIITH